MNENEKELNQTTNNEAVEKEVNIADIRKKIETRYEEKLNKAQIEFMSQLEATNKELEFYKTKLPQLEVAFTKNGGNKEYFQDWLTLNKDNINYDNLDDFIKDSLDKFKWAKNVSSFDVLKTLNHAAGENRRLDLEEFEPGTVYKKMK